MILLGHANHPQKDVAAEIEWAAEHGFDFVDLFLEPGEADPAKVEPAAVREALARHGLSAPVGHMSPGLYLGSAMPQLRTAAVATAGAYLQVFAAIGVGAIIIQ